MQITVTYTCDWTSKSGDDQHGRIDIKTPMGSIHATWECVGGMGRGAEVRENESELSDDEADELVNRVLRHFSSPRSSSEFQ